MIQAQHTQDQGIELAGGRSLLTRSDDFVKDARQLVQHLVAFVDVRLGQLAQRHLLDVDLELDCGDQ